VNHFRERLTVMTTILALELGKFKSVCCFFHPDNGELRYVTVESTPATIGLLLDKAKAEGVACVIFEACVLTGWVARLLAGGKEESGKANLRRGAHRVRGAAGGSFKRRRSKATLTMCRCPRPVRARRCQASPTQGHRHRPRHAQTLAPRLRHLEERQTVR
jgi:hypothetical protein